MSKEKMINARLQQKHDLEKNWMLAENFIPKIGELIVYDAETSVEDITDKNGNLIRENICEYSRLKIGDGITIVGNLAFADDNLRKELEKYVLKEEQATIKGKGLDSTQLHTGPVQALGKYQVVAGMYNEPDPIAKYKEISLVGTSSSMPGQDAMASFIKVTPPIFDSINGIFKANIILEGSDWESGDIFIKRENIDYQPGQEVTFVEYFIYEDGISYSGKKIEDNTQELGRYAVIVGNGDSEDLRSNAYTLDWKGNASFSGKVFTEKTEELAKLSKVPHFYEEKNYSTEVPVIFSVYAEAYLNYETPWYAIGTEPFASFEKETMYCVSIDEEKYYVISDGYSLKTVENTSDLAKQGDFIIRNHFRASSFDSEPSEVSRNIFLPGTTQEEHLITITKVNKVMVPEEIIPETIARKTDVIEQQVTIKGTSPNSTQLHTGPINAMTKHQVVAGRYNELDAIYGVETYKFPVPAQYEQETPIIIFNEEPVLNIYEGYFTATISSIGTIADFVEGEHYFIPEEDFEDSNYEVGQTLIFTKYKKTGNPYDYCAVDRSRVDEEGKYAFIIGNGISEDKRSNAHTIDWEGNAYYAGNLEGKEINGKRVTVGSERKEVAKLEDVPHISLVELFNTYSQATFEITDYSVKYSDKKAVFRPFEIGKEYIIKINENTYTVIAQNDDFKNSASGSIEIEGGDTKPPMGTGNSTTTLPPKDTYTTVLIGSLKTTEYAGDFVGEGDFGINLFETVNDNNPEDVIYTYTVYLPLNTGLEHSVVIYERSVKEVSEEIIPETIARKTDILQSDWNQNDETATDFIKNRTHYIGNGILLETTEAQTIGTETFGEVYSINKELPLVLGEKYIITYNNNSCECIAQVPLEGIIDDPDALALGNQYIIGGDDDTGEPFILGYSPLYKQIIVTDLDKTEFQILRIEGYGAIYPIDEKFLPEEYRNLIPTIEEFGSEIEGLSNRISNFDDYSVQVIKQNFSDVQKAQARENIGAFGISEISTVLQSNLSEVDENSVAYVKGVLQERHLPSFLPTSPQYNSYEDGSGDIIMEIDFDESKWDEVNNVYTIFSLEERNEVLNFIDKLYSTGQIACLLIDDERIVLSECLLIDNTYPLYASEDAPYVLSTAYNTLSLMLPKQFNILKILAVPPMIDGAYRLLNIHTIPPQIVRLSQLNKAIASRSQVQFITWESDD